MKDPSIPSFVVQTEQQIDITIAPTDATVVDQGYTYNQAGVMYGGISQTNQDVAPVFFDDTVTLLSPSISSIIDIYSPFVPPPANSGYLMGIMGLTYP